MNVLFVLAVELCVHVWLHVWVYTHIYMLLKMSIRKIIFHFEHFCPYLYSVLTELPLKEKMIFFFEMSFSPLLAKNHIFRTKKKIEASIVQRHLCIVNFKRSLGTVGVKLLLPIKYRHHETSPRSHADGQRAPEAYLPPWPEV